MPDMSAFEKELERLINAHSMENLSDTPDFILAKYLATCLGVFSYAVKQREQWYGRGPQPLAHHDDPAASARIAAVVQANAPVERGETPP